MQEAEAQRAKAAALGGKPFKHVTHRTGFMGLWGKVERSRSFYQQRIDECETDIDFERQFVFKHGYARSYFVVFETQVRPLSGCASLFVIALVCSSAVPSLQTCLGGLQRCIP